jgi:hypothetical protein
MRKIADNSLDKSNYTIFRLARLYVAEKTNKEKINDFRDR